MHVQHAYKISVLLTEPFPHLQNYNFNYLLLVCICMICMHDVCIHVCMYTNEEVRGQLCGVTFTGVLELELRSQTWWQAPLPTKSSHLSHILLLWNGVSLCSPG